MYFIIHFTAITNAQFLKTVQKLTKVGPSQVSRILLTIPSLVLEPTTDGSAAAVLDQEYSGFLNQFDSFLPTNQNKILERNLDDKIKSIISKNNELYEGDLISGSWSDENSITADLLIFDKAELSQNPQVIDPLFKALESRPCSVLFLDSETVALKKIILKYTGNDSSIYSIFSFTRLFPDIAREAEDSILISPFSFRRLQLAVEKRFVKQLISIYGALGYIKLPFNDVEDYLYYAIKVKADLMIFPKTDLCEIKNLIIEHKHK